MLSLEVSISNVYSPYDTVRRVAETKSVLNAELSWLQSFLELAFETLLFGLYRNFLMKGAAKRAKLGTSRRCTYLNPRNYFSFITVVAGFKLHITSDI